MKKTLSLRCLISLALILGLLLPAFFSSWYATQQQRAALSLDFEDDQQRLVSLLASGLAFNAHSKTTTQGLLDAAALDERVVQIIVSDNKHQILAQVQRPERQHGQVRMASKALQWQNTAPGEIGLGMDTGRLETSLWKEYQRFLLTSAAQLGLCLSLVLFILNTRFVAPLKRLLTQSTQLERRELDKPFVWQRHDEFDTLSSSLESTRLSLRTAFKEIQESEQRFRSLTEFSSDWYWERDAQDRLTLISQGIEEMTGLTPVEMLGSKRGVRNNFFYLPEQWNDYQNKIAAREPFHNLEWQVTRDDGQIRYGSTSGEPFFNAEGHFLGYRGIGKDITISKLAETAQKSATRLRRLVEHLPTGAIYIENGLALMNQAAEIITGYSRAEITNTAQWFGSIFGENAELNRSLYEADKSAGFPRPREIEILHKGGTRRVIEFSAYCDEYCEFWLLHDITQTKAAKLALEQTLLEQQAIFDNATVAIYRIKNKVIERCNRRMEEMLGYGPGELEGQSTRILFASDAAWIDYGTNAYASIWTGHSWVSEVEIIRKNGTMMWCRGDGKAIDLQDQSQGTIWVADDITERKRAAEELQLTLLEQEAIFANATAGIALTKNRVIQRCNRWLEQMLGYDAGELSGTATRLHHVSEESYDAMGRSAYEAIAAGQSWVSEWMVKRKDGSKIWCLYNGKAIDPNDLKKGEVWVIQDINERKQTEFILQQTLLEQQALLDNTVIGIAFVKDRMIVRSNGGIEQILGYSTGELVGKSTRCWYESDEAHSLIGEQIYPVTSAGKVFSTDLQFLRKDGSKVWCHFLAKAIHAGDPGKGGVCVLLDISARKTAEQALIAAKNDLEHGLIEIEQTYSEVTLLAELSSFLQACETEQEAFSSIVSYGSQLFPASVGVLYLMEDEMLLEQVAWGNSKQADLSFTPNECWALRRGQVYRMDNPDSRLCCPHLHITGSQAFPYVCLPLGAQGKTFGLLFIEHRRSLEEGGRRDMRHRLAVALAEQIGLALANIRIRESLRLQSIRDPLTGLYNRRYMNDILRRELARAKRSNTHLAVAIIDVDHFKKFNDTHGHDAGDLVLQNVAKALEECVRQSDVVCRFGGEEFVILLPEISCELAQDRAGGVLEALRKLDLQHGNKSLGRITASLGLALYPHHGLLPEALIVAADQALYQAKNAGRNCFMLSELKEDV